MGHLVVDSPHVGWSLGNTLALWPFVVTQEEFATVVKASDFDNDGDQDLFVGIRLIPQKYGLPANGYILENDGEGIFKNITDSIAPDLKKVGMITDASWIDFDKDGDQDIIVVGHWMPITLYTNHSGKFQKSEIKFAKYNF